jgi:hypothetical protein
MRVRNLAVSITAAAVMGAFGPAFAGETNAQSSTGVTVSPSVSSQSSQSTTPSIGASGSISSQSQGSVSSGSSSQSSPSMNSQSSPSVSSQSQSSPSTSSQSSASSGSSLDCTAQNQSQSKAYGLCDQSRAKSQSGTSASDDARMRENKGLDGTVSSGSASQGISQGSGSVK